MVAPDQRGFSSAGFTVDVAASCAICSGSLVQRYFTESKVRNTEFLRECSYLKCLERSTAWQGNAQTGIPAAQDATTSGMSKQHDATFLQW